MSELSRVRVLGAVLAVGLLALSACSEEPAKPKPLPSSSSSSSASPSPSAPTLPPEARGASEESAEAFARHYVDLINYAMHSGDTSMMRQLSGPTCSTCKTVAAGIDKVYQAGGHMERGDWKAGGTRPAEPLRGSARHIQVDIRIVEQKIVERADARPKIASPTNGTLDFYLGRSTNKWIVDHLVAKR